MIRIVKLLVPVLFLMSSLAALGQMHKYQYKSEISGVKDRWHKIVLTQDVLKEMQNDLSDIRIYGINDVPDTLEIPYVWNVLTTKDVQENVGFSMLNFSKNNDGYFYTFQIDNEELINQILLNFYRSNFDWRINLEGSHDQNNWFTILEDYRILNIHNNDTKFNFTNLNFPNSRYTYYRLFIKSKTDPKFESATISSRQVEKGKVNSYPIHIVSKSEESTKKSVYTLALDEKVRISSISISVKSDFDYYRPLTISELQDSIETETETKYTYATLATGTLNSLEKNTFSFPSTTVSQLKIVVENGDNQPLDLGEIVANGFEHQLIARFNDQADYYLAYGNSNGRKPHYDIVRFKENIPSELTALSVGKGILIPRKKEEASLPLFENKRWLWAVLIFAMALLGWFTLKMMRGNSESN